MSVESTCQPLRGQINLWQYQPIKSFSAPFTSFLTPTWFLEDQKLSPQASGRAEMPAPQVLAGSSPSRKKKKEELHNELGQCLWPREATGLLLLSLPTRDQRVHGSVCKIIQEQETHGTPWAASKEGEGKEKPCLFHVSIHYLVPACPQCFSFSKIARRVGAATASIC